MSNSLTLLETYCKEIGQNFWVGLDIGMTSTAAKAWALSKVEDKALPEAHELLTAMLQQAIDDLAYADKLLAGATTKSQKTDRGRTHKAFDRFKLGVHQAYNSVYAKHEKIAAKAEGRPVANSPFATSPA